MDLIQLAIPAAFVTERTRLSWREVQFGIENQLLAPAAPIELAMAEVAATEHPSEALLEVAAAGAGDPIRAAIERLARAELEHDERAIRDKLLYVVLAWIYVHKDGQADPLHLIELVYADFGYPEHIANLVRYMPSDEPPLATREDNERRLVGRWKQYLDRSAATYSPS